MIVLLLGVLCVPRGKTEIGFVFWPSQSDSVNITDCNIAFYICCGVLQIGFVLHNRDPVSFVLV